MGIALSLAGGAAIEMFKEKEDSLGIILSIGTIIFRYGFSLHFFIIDKDLPYKRRQNLYTVFRYLARYICYTILGSKLVFR